MASRASPPPSSTFFGGFLAADDSKRWSEMLYLVYSPFWIIYALVLVVPMQLYEHFGKAEYMLLCSIAAVPCVLLPLCVLTPCRADERRPLHERHWFRANLWVAIFSYIGNYFWTHYFYRVLGAYYTFESWQLNHVPICLYLMTHAYFMFYHALANVVLRKVIRMTVAEQPRGGSASKAAAGDHWSLKTYVAYVCTVFLLSYATAFMETLTIANFKYYTFVDKGKMYSVGSLFYAIYFFVSFPMFFRMDEDMHRISYRPRTSGVFKVKSEGAGWSVARVVIDALAAGMLVTILLDLWRLVLGPVIDPSAIPEFVTSRSTLPWL